MTLMERVQAELRDAMKSGDRQRLEALRLVYSSLQKAEKDAPEFNDDRAGTLDDVPREHWDFLRDGLLDYYETDRHIFVHATVHCDLDMAEQPEYVLFWEFLPAAMSESELEQLVDAVIAETGATSMKDMGRVMGLVTERGQGRADGRVASALVRSRLTA